MEKQRLSKKVFHICIIFSIIVMIIFAAIMIVLRYDVKGETNMPFKISKIAIISTVNGEDVENSEHKWAIDTIQNNDINIYIEKNQEYKKTETINNIKISNINVKNEPKIGSIKIYKPSDRDENSIFQNISENETNQIEITATKTPNIKKCEISNQGGIICFRCANNEIGQFSSNEEEEVKYDELLKKLNIDENNLKATITFDIEITLDSGRIFKTENIELNLPNDGIVSEGTKGIEITDLNDIIFKRVEN